MPIHFSDSFLSNSWGHSSRIQTNLRGTILGAGLGRRLDPLTTHHLPKPLFPLGGKVPIAEVWIQRMIESGITDVSMNICVLAETIKRHFGNGSRFGIDLKYLEEDTPTGTLGAVCKQALGVNTKQLDPEKNPSTISEFTGSTILAPSGDIVTNFDSDLLEEMYATHRKMGAAITMVVTQVAENRKKDFGTVVLKSPDQNKGLISQSGQIEQFIEKDQNSPSNLTNASIYMIEMDLLKTIDKVRTDAKAELENPFYDFGKHVFPAMLGKLPYIKLPKDYLLWAIQYDGGWFDVGNKRDYLKVNQHLLDGRINVALPYEKLLWGYLGTNVSIDFSTVDIHPPVVIGNDCVIEPGVKLGPYAIIGDGWIVEKNSTIRNSVLWERYSYFPKNGAEVSAADRRLIDRHEVRRDVTIDESIIASGTITTDVTGKTVHVLETGELEGISIDYIPDEPRA
ncbi:MAG: hypothetical protein GKS05_02775 [Nitrospirales bacterium]|nr:hypothetical protein [Nitrospirales bacterium]